MYKYMTPVSKNLYIDNFDDAMHKNNNKYHRTIKVKPADVKSSTYIDSSKGINDEDPKSNIGDIVRISKYKNTFAKSYVPNWCEETFVIKKVKNTCRGYMLLLILVEKKLLERFKKKNFKK